MIASEMVELSSCVVVRVQGVRLQRRNRGAARTRRFARPSGVWDGFGWDEDWDRAGELAEDEARECAEGGTEIEWGV